MKKTENIYFNNKKMIAYKTKRKKKKLSQKTEIITPRNQAIRNFSGKKKNTNPRQQ